MPKRQQQIYFRSLALPPSKIDGDEDAKKTGDYCPHFLAALQLITHVMVPLRKALVHFYVSYRNKDVQKMEWLVMLGFGRLCKEMISASHSSGSSVLSGGSSSANTGSLAADSVDPASLKPVSTERFFPVLYTCLLKHDLNKWPKDVTEAIQVLFDCLKCCTRTLPVTNQLWSALLDKACLGLIASQSLVGRKRMESLDQKEVVQRSLTEQVIMWCPHVLPIADLSRIPKPSTIGDDDEEPAPTLYELLQADFKKRPLHTTARSYYDFDKKSYDFEVEIPTKFFDPKDKEDDVKSFKNGENGKSEVWKTTRSMQFSSLTGYLFLGIDRTKKPQKKEDGGDDKEASDETIKIDRSELTIPATLDLTKLCSKKKIAGANLPEKAIYELVGGALYDDGDYVAVLKDFSAVIAAEERSAADISHSNTHDSSDEDEDETWKLMEAEETIPMGESDVLEFLKGEGNEEDEDGEESDEDYGPCGTLAVYKLKTSPMASKSTTVFDEMNQLLSDIVISQVSGALNSKTDFYIEEEVIEEVIED